MSEKSLYDIDIKWQFFDDFRGAFHAAICFEKFAKSMGYITDTILECRPVPGIVRQYKEDAFCSVEWSLPSKPGEFRRAVFAYPKEQYKMLVDIRLIGLYGDK